MSGALGSLGTAIGTGIRLGQGISQSYHALSNLLAGGDSPQPGTVQVGSVNLGSFGCPETIAFGGTQAVTVHQLPGGARVLDAMGPVDMALRWRGILLGPDAVSQARALDLIRQKGVIVPVAWDDFDYDVLVSSFEADYRRSAWIGEYRIECIVQSDYSGPQPSVGLLGGLLGGTALGGVLGSVGSALGEAASTVGAVVQSAQQVVGAAASVVTPITSALGIHVPFLNTVSQGLAQAGGLASAVGGVSTGLSGLSAFQSDVSGVGSLAVLGLQNVGQSLGLISTVTPLDQVADLAGAQAGFAYAGAQAGGAASVASQVSSVPQAPLSLSGNPGFDTAQDAFNTIKATTPLGTTDGGISLVLNNTVYTFNGAGQQQTAVPVEAPL